MKRGDQALVGVRFGRLVVVERAGKTNWNELLWLCRCECGSTPTVRGKNLRSGQTQSCGCLALDTKPGLRHGGKGTRLYRIWSGLKNRCTNPNAKDFYRYGGAGVLVCPEWRASFGSFRDWAVPAGYADNLYIDRVDSRGNYEPTNCRWVTPADSSRNQRNVKLSVESAQRIRELVAAGASHSEVAKQFDVCRSSVSLICEGRHWL